MGDEKGERRGEKETREGEVRGRREEGGEMERREGEKQRRVIREVQNASGEREGLYLEIVFRQRLRRACAAVID